MEKLNEYLQTLLSTCSYELHLEPNKTPYLTSDNGTTEINKTPLLGTQISLLVFPLIPNSVKQELPNKPQIEFVHTNNLGDFSFLVKKSAAGFIVTVRPVLPVSAKADEAANYDDSAFNETEVSPAKNPANVSYKTLPTLISPEEKQSFREDISPAKSLNNFAAEFSTSVQFENYSDSAATPISETKPDYQNDNFSDSKPEIEVVPFYDSEFTTKFSDTSTYEPPLRPQEFAAAYTTPENPFNSRTPLQQTYEPLQTIGETGAAEKNPPADKTMDALFYKMAEAGASDLHLSVSMPPMIRQDGKMMTLEADDTTLTADVMKELLTSIMPAKN